MKYAALAAAFALLTAAGVASAAEEAGRAEYMASCAGCHGENGQGDGPLASVLSVTPPDLTQLTAKNDGEFPLLETLMIVDGREGVRAHGSAMPIWGDRFTASALITQDPAIADLVARGRILSLVYYLQSIQQ
jgi:mono/diheme cytochrome c family protein